MEKIISWTSGDELIKIIKQLIDNPDEIISPDEIFRICKFLVQFKLGNSDIGTMKDYLKHFDEFPDNCQYLVIYVAYHGIEKSIKDLNSNIISKHNIELEMNNIIPNIYTIKGMCKFILDKYRIEK